MDAGLLNQRYEMLKGMHTIICQMNDENAYYNHWIYIVPDGAREEDLLSIAEDDELFKDTTVCFLDCMLRYGKDGLVTTKSGCKLYKPSICGE